MMKAIVITPKKQYSARVIEMSKPIAKEDEVLVKVLEAGVCTTDREIYEGQYGEPPPGEDFLVMGHESLGVVESVGSKVGDLQKGDYVVRTVRTPCPEYCPNCRRGEQDHCQNDTFAEIGIKELHGIMTEFYADSPKNLVKVGKEHKDVGVLLEPLSFSVKAVRQSKRIQHAKMYWELKKALVFGAGPIGLLETFILRSEGVATDVVARSKKGNYKSEIVQKLGGNYYSIDELDQLGKYDLVIECSGHSENVTKGLEHLNKNGILCSTSITGGNRMETINADKRNIDRILGSRTNFGAVNSNYKDYVEGVRLFSVFESKWPGLLQKLVTKRVPFTDDLDVHKLLGQSRGDVKVVLKF